MSRRSAVSAGGEAPKKNLTRSRGGSEDVREEWKAVTERAKRTKLRFELLTHTDEPARGSPLPLCWYKKNLIRRTTPSTCWIAAVSAAEEISRKVREVREVLNKKAGVSSRFRIFLLRLSNYVRFAHAHGFTPVARLLFSLTQE